MIVVLAVAALVYRAGPSGHIDDGVGPSTTTTVSSGPATSGPLIASSTMSAPRPSPPVAAAGIDRLEVAEPSSALPAYRRAAFGDGWDYDPTSGCNTRERVLIAESLTPPSLTGRCHPDLGSWRSSYDGVTLTDPRGLEIDHLVSLADAWRSGAAAWSDAQRAAYANDLSDPNTLAAVTSHANRSKSDATPDEWLPPDRSAWCAYVTDWVEVKSRWHLSVTLSEKSTLVQVLSGC